MFKNCFLLIMVAAVSNVDAALVNNLNNHPSPYLAMHGSDPVAWQAWGPEVLEKARKENKLIFISVGYFSCHWCHVMQKESYKDEVIAKRLNSNFIPVKVDRELHPALDAYLIEFVRSTRGYAGWPLNVFVTPSGHPVVGIVYLPKEQFRSLLIQLDELWNKNSDSMQTMAIQAAQLQQDKSIEKTELDPALGKELHTRLLQDLMQVADDMLGGFGDQTKFPMIAQLRFLLEAYEQKPYQQVGDFLQLTLEQMATQGLRDHVGGGFFRYTVDPDWQTPHFEKMLYDNALLAVLYLDAAELFKRKDFEAIGRETLDFMINELTAKQGAMVASLSAVDEQGVEGGYYLHTKVYLIKHLTEQEYEVVSLLWKLNDAQRFDAGYLPMHAMSPDEVAKKLGKQTDEVMSLLAKAQMKLFLNRRSRGLPVDTKLLASWNGLALSALVRGAQLDSGQKYHAAAQRIRDYIVKQLWDGRVLHRARDAFGGIGNAGLEDYVYSADGLLHWALLVESQNDKLLAERWMDIAWQRFYTPTGWQRSDNSLLPAQLGVPVIEDNPMPSPSSLLIKNTLFMANLNQDKKSKDRALSALGVGQELIKQQPFSYALQIRVLADTIK